MFAHSFLWPACSFSLLFAVSVLSLSGSGPVLFLYSFRILFCLPCSSGCLFQLCAGQSATHRPTASDRERQQKRREEKESSQNLKRRIYFPFSLSPSCPLVRPRGFLFSITILSNQQRHRQQQRQRRRRSSATNKREEKKFCGSRSSRKKWYQYCESF